MRLLPPCALLLCACTQGSITPMDTEPTPDMSQPRDMSVTDVMPPPRDTTPDVTPDPMADTTPDLEPPEDQTPDVSDMPVEPAEVLAFPSARGAGARVTGGRGGRVLRVTTLADSGPGSLREALEASGPRIITFAVSGTIELRSTLRPGSGDFTIAGQTAPRGGVTLTSQRRTLLLDDADNFIIRYIRVRPVYTSVGRNENGADAVELLGATNYILDHVSVSWGNDEVLSSRGMAFGGTFQRILFAEGKTGSLFGDSNDPSLSRDLSFHHNAFYNITHRHPNIHADGRVDHYNNVIFNWRFRWSVVLGRLQLNHVANHYSRGCLGTPSGQTSFNKVFYNADYAPELHSAGNLVVPDFLTDPMADNSVLWNWRVDVTSGPYAGAMANTQLTTDYFVPAPFPLLGPPATISTAQEAFDDVTQDVGANARVDASGNVISEIDDLDAKYLADIRAGDCVEYESSSRGQNFGDTPHHQAFHASVSETPIDTHTYEISSPDGIPDPWKVARGFAATDDLTTHIWPSGYIGIEEYLNAVDR